MPESESSRGELLVAHEERDAVIAALLAWIEQLDRRVGMDLSSSSMPPGSVGPHKHYDQAVHWGVLTNRHRDWPGSRHPDFNLSRRLLAQRAHRHALLPRALLSRHHPQPRHPSARRSAQRAGRTPLNGAENRLINHRTEWMQYVLYHS